MAEPVQTIAKAMEVGGASVAVGPWVVYMMGWLDYHTQAVMSICAIIGAITTVVGMFLHVSANWYFKSREDSRRQQAHNAMFVRNLSEQTLKHRHRN